MKLPPPTSPASEESAENDEKSIISERPANEISTEAQTPPQANLDNPNGCSNNNGGCQHICTMVPNGNEPSVQCSCKNGYYLDSSNGQTCVGE